MLTLYFAPGSSSFATHIALHEIGVPFEAKPVSFAKKETHEAWFLKLNGLGKVPTLLIDGRPMTEVAATLYYLARKYPEAGLWPAGDIEAEARAIEWMSFVASTLHPARTQGPEHARQVYGVANARLGKNDWAVGTYSIADIHLFRLYWRFHKSLELDPSFCPAVHAHYERMLARPAVKKTIEAETAAGYQLPA